MSGCPRERDVLRAVARDWTGAGDTTVARHLEGCARCAEVRSAAEILRSLHLREIAGARVPSAGATWWRLERRRREVRLRRVQRLAFAVQAVVLAAAAGAGAAVLQIATPWLRGPAAATLGSWGELAQAFTAWSDAASGWTLPLVLLMAACLVLIPATLYLVLADE